MASGAEMILLLPVMLAFVATTAVTTPTTLALKLRCMLTKVSVSRPNYNFKMCAEVRILSLIRIQVIMFYFLQ